VWIDNIRWFGPAADVAVASSRADEFARRCNATWKLEDTRDLVQEYDFIGLHFNHAAKTVCLSEKNATKLPDSMPRVISYEDLEVLVGRLIYAAGAMCIPLVKVWWPIKWSRRRYHDFNGGEIQLKDLLQIPVSAYRGFVSWLQKAKVPYHVPRTPVGGVSALFSDASLGGWGAVLITSLQEVFIAGGTWPTKHESGEINVLEAKALDNGLTHLMDAFLRSPDVAIDIHVDNTSCEAAIRRGVARSPALNVALAPVIEALRMTNIPTTIQYVSTLDNVADAPSRGLEVDYDVAKRVSDMRRGGGRVPMWCSNPIRS
jgi:hypothetical protein